MAVDTIDAATQEAYASARDTVRLWDTLELYHPDWASTLRIVNDTIDQDFMLEKDAPRNAGTEQTFSAFSLKATLPRRAEVGRQELAIGIDNVSLEAFDLLRTADAANGAVQIIYRQFCNADITKPGRVHTLYAKSVTVNSKEAVLSGLYADDINKKFPKLLFDSTNWPGLFR